MFVNGSDRELIERAENLILRIRDVQSCRIFTDETGEITEVHVVASSDRPPKLIARDVETILKAEIGIAIDHRKIGVVLIDHMRDTSGMHHYKNAQARPFAGAAVDEVVDEVLSEQPAKLRAAGEREEIEPSIDFLEEDVRARFKGVSLTLEESRVDVEVRLVKNGLEVTGCMSDVRSSAPLHEAIAGATIHALTELLDVSFHLCLSGIEEVIVAGRKAICAVVDVVEGRTVTSFVGCVLQGRDPNEAAVLAVLDAVNRPFGRWKSRKEIHYTIR